MVWQVTQEMGDITQKHTSRTSSQYRFWFAFLLAFSYLVIFMQRTGPGVISDQLQHQFQVSAAVLGAVSSVQYLLYMVLQVPVGFLGDKFGPERLFAYGVLLDGIGTFLFSQASSFSWLLIGRSMVGLGDALIWVNIVLMLTKQFQGGSFGSVLSIVTIAGNLGALLTTIPFAMWVAISGWRIPFAALSWLLLAISVIDYLFFYGPRWPWHPRRRGNGESSPSRPQPVKPWTVLREVVRDRNAWATFCTHFAAVGTYIGFVSVWAVPYIMSVYHESRTTATTFTMTAFFAAMFGAPIAGAVSDRLRQRRKPYVFFQLLACAGWFAVPLMGGHPPRVLLYLIMIVVGLSSGASMLTFAVIRDQTPPARSGVTSGFANTGGFLSAVVLPVLFGFVIDTLSPGYAHGLQASTSSFAMAFLVPAVFSLFGVIGSLMIVERR